MTEGERALNNLRDNIAIRLIQIQEYCEAAGFNLDGITFIGRDTTNDNMVIVLTNEPAHVAPNALAVAARYLEPPNACCRMYRPINLAHRGTTALPRQRSRSTR